jgi:hypothetical protein
MFRIVLACSGVPALVGEEAASDITAEFAEHRPWHTNVSCEWDGERLVLSAENDLDGDGAALSDEFSDAIAAYIAEPFDGSISVESVREILPAPNAPGSGDVA